MEELKPEMESGPSSACIHSFAPKELDTHSTHEIGGRHVADNWVEIKLTWVFKVKMAPVASPCWAAVKLFLPEQIRNISSWGILHWVLKN